MVEKARLHFENQCFKIEGCLNFQTVADLWKQSRPLMAKSTHLKFDFSGVTVLNSAALALLFEWIKYARQQKKTISFCELPNKLISLAQSAGIDTLILNGSS